MWFEWATFSRVAHVRGIAIVLWGPYRILPACLAALAGLVGATGSALADEAVVDLELVLAVDASGSVDAYEFELQMRGIAAAFRDPEVQDALRATGDRGVAVVLVQWSGRRQQAVVVDWLRLLDAASARRFAAQVEGAGRLILGETAIASALDFARELLAQNRFEGHRQVIDISGDGPSNAGRDPEAARDDAAAAGITINGLAIINEIADLDHYYREHVIGGPDAFLVRARDYEDFAEAMRVKLIREIRGSPIALYAPPEALTRAARPTG